MISFVCTLGQITEKLILEHVRKQFELEKPRVFNPPSTTPDINKSPWKLVEKRKQTTKN